MLTVTSLALVFASTPAHAWAIGSQLNNKGCHELITAEALRRTRMKVTTAPVINPDRNESAFIADLLFSPPIDLVNDLGGISLLLGVRDNDLKGINPFNTLELTQVHGNPTTQEEHCIRRLEDDGATGDQAALEACRVYIRETATAALDGLDAAGKVDATNRKRFKFFAQIAGEIDPMLPRFYVTMGPAMHALEDGFTHTFRSADGSHVTTVLNWIDFAKLPFDEARDGPAHIPALDDCQHLSDPTVARNFGLATDAVTELLTVALDPKLSRAEKIVGFDTVTAKWLAYQPGCNKENNWCDVPDAKVQAAGGCATGGDAPWSALVLVGGVLILISRRRAAAASGKLALAALLALGTANTAARADSILLPGSVATKENGAPDVVVINNEVKVKTPAGDFGKWAFTTSLGGAILRTAAVGEVGVRYRINDAWLVGGDIGWNPWITTAPIGMRNGVAFYDLTLIRRFPMKFERVNLRSTVHVGASTLLFDIYGVPKYSTGPYIGVSFLGIDIDLGKRTRLVIDPAEFALPVPHIGQIPLWYEQFRFMVGLQIGV